MYLDIQQLLNMELKSISFMQHEDSQFFLFLLKKLCFLFMCLHSKPWESFGCFIKHNSFSLFSSTFSQIFFSSVPFLICEANHLTIHMYQLHSKLYQIPNTQFEQHITAYASSSWGSETLSGFPMHISTHRCTGTCTHMYILTQTHKI